MPIRISASNLSTVGQVDPVSGEFHPSDISDYFLDIDPTVLSLTSGDNIPSITTIDDNEHVIAQGTSGNQPKYYDNVVNGKPVIRADGIDDYMDNTTTIPQGLRTTTAMTVFFVGDLDTITSTYRLFSLRNNLSSTRPRVAMVYQNSGKIAYEAAPPPSGDYLLASSDGAISADTFFSARIEANATHTKLFIDDVQVATDSGGHAPGDLTNTYGVFRIFSYANSLPAQFFSGDMARFIVYKKQLTSLEIDNVEGYLASEFGL